MLFEHIICAKFPSFEHVGSPPPTDKFLDKTTVAIEPPGRNVSVPGADESWMDDLSAAEVLQQYDYNPNVILTSEGKLVLPDGGNAEQISSTNRTIHLLPTVILRVRQWKVRPSLTIGSF